MKAKTIYLAGVVALAILLTSSMAHADSTGFKPAAISGGESLGVQTFPMADFDDGRARVEFDWRDNTGDILRFRCVNNSAGHVWAGVYLWDPATSTKSLQWEGTCAPGQTVTYPVSKFKVYWETGDLDGDGVPDGGLVLGNYILATGWTAN